MSEPALSTEMTRRRVLVLGVGTAIASVLAACGATGTSTGSASTGAAGGGGASGTDVRIVDGNRFEPGELVIRAGDTVTWRNDSEVMSGRILVQA